MVLNKIINPAVIFEFTNQTLVFNKTINTSLIVLKLCENYPLFNEKLQVAELEYLSLELKKLKLFPFFGLYLDINNAWEYFSETDTEVFRNKSKEIFDHDKKVLNEPINPDNQIDILINYLKDKATEKGLL